MAVHLTRSLTLSDPAIPVQRLDVYTDPDTPHVEVRVARVQTTDLPLSQETITAIFTDSHAQP